MNIHLKAQTSSSDSRPDTLQDQASSALGSSFENLLSSLGERFSVSLPAIDIAAAPKAASASSVQRNSTHKGDKTPVLSQPQAKEAERRPEPTVDRDVSVDRSSDLAPARERGRDDDQRQESAPTVNSPTPLPQMPPPVSVPVSDFSIQQQLTDQSGQLQPSVSPSGLSIQ